MASRRAPTFAFIIHARDAADFYRWKGSRLLRDYSTSDEEFLAKITTSDPLCVGELSFGVGRAYGELVAVMRSAEQVLDSGGRDDVHAAVDVATRRGARWIGLGALTAPVTGAGASVVPRVAAGVHVTTGNAFTAAVCRANVAEAAEQMQLRTPRVAVLGATGSVGYACSALLIEDGYDVTLLGRTLSKTRALLGEMASRAHLDTGMEHLMDADIVVVLTSAAGARVAPEHVRPGATIIDVCQPCNVTPDAIEAFDRRGVTVCEGGLVEIAGYSSSYDLDLPGRRTTFACLAETYLMAAEGIAEHSVGSAKPDFAKRLAAVAPRHGVAVKPLHVHRPPVAAEPTAELSAVTKESR